MAKNSIPSVIHRYSPFLLLGVTYAVALVGAVKMVSRMGAFPAVMLAMLVVGGMAVALNIVVRKARAAGSLPPQTENRPITILGVIVCMSLVMGVAVGFILNVALGAVLFFLLVFGMMGALVLVLLFVRIENDTRAGLTA